MKKLIAASLCFMLMLSIPAQAAGDCGPEISAMCAAVYDPLTEELLFSKNADLQRGIASTTKIMTALVALELFDLEETVSIRPEWCGIEGSSIYLKAGERLKVRDLLYGLMLESGNDAAEALAGLHPGGKEGFVAAMNELSARLELKNTHFDNPSGLDGETHFSTAGDLARLAGYAMEQTVFAEIVGTERITLGERFFKNHNRLLKEIDACGIKTGFTKASGRCLVSAKQQDARMLICVTLNAPDDWGDHKQLYEQFLPQYQERLLVGGGDCGSVPLVSSEKKESRLYCNESFSFFLSEDEIEELDIRLVGPRFRYGSVRAGDRYGRLQVRLRGRVLWETAVYYGTTSEELQPPQSWWKHIRLGRRTD